MLRLVLVVASFFCACFSPPAPIIAPPDAASDDADARGAPRVHLEVSDRLGHAYDEGAPTWPRLRIFTTAPIADPSAAMLLEGPSYDALYDDLESSPLRAATRAAIIETTRTVDDRGLLLEVQGHLRRGARYHVALAPWAFAEDDGAAAREPPLPFVVPLDIADAPELGAWATDSWPADATHGVPTDLPFVVLRFDGSVDLVGEVLTLEGPSGVVEGVVEGLLCDGFGFRDGTCAMLRLSRRLEPGASYLLRVAPTLIDRTGAPVGPFAAELTTALFEAAPTTFVSLTCGLDEREAGPACVLADDRRIVVRVAASGPARFFLTGGTHRRVALAPRGAAELVLDGLSPDEDLSLTLALVDLSGRQEQRTLRLSTTEPLAPLSITEVRLDPRGPEPAQEYVELLNSGAMPIDLAGFALADREDRVGDVVGRPSLVPAGGRALLVSDSFDSAHPADGAVPGGVPLIRIGTSLASGGLSNAGEPLFLRDALGRRISAAPSAATGSGLCLTRVSADLRTGDAAAFVTGECTPGRPP